MLHLLSFCCDYRESGENKLGPEILPVAIPFHINNTPKDLSAGQHKNKRQCRQYFSKDSKQLDSYIQLIKSMMNLAVFNSLFYSTE